MWRWVDLYGAPVRGLMCVECRFIQLRALFTCDRSRLKSTSASGPNDSLSLTWTMFASVSATRSGCRKTSICNTRWLSSTVPREERLAIVVENPEVAATEPYFCRLDFTGHECELRCAPAVLRPAAG